MIRFDVEKLRTDYVFLTKVTDQFAYVLCDREGEVYAPEGSIPGTQFGRNIRKVRLHPMIAARFFKENHGVRDFSVRPVLAGLTYYGEKMLAIEICTSPILRDGGETAERFVKQWKAMADLSKDDLRQLTSDKECWINGREILWLAPAEEMCEGGVRLDEEGAFRVRMVGSIDLVRITRRPADFEVLESKAFLGGVNIDAPGIIPHHGLVLAYYPGIQDSEGREIAVYSPSLRREQAKDGSKRSSRMRHLQEQNDATGNVDELRRVYELMSNTNPFYPNLDFVLFSARVIGKLYGNEAVDFLDLPAIIVQIGETNFHRIHAKARSMIPLHHLHIRDALAWVFGYLYREDDLYRTMELTRMVRYIMSRGIVRKSQIQTNLKEGVSAADLPLKSGMPVSLANRPAPSTQADQQDMLAQATLQAFRETPTMGFA